MNEQLTLLCLFILFSSLSVSTAFPHCHCYKSGFFRFFYSCHCHFSKGYSSLNAGHVRRGRRRRQKPVHAQSLRDSLLGQRDPQHAAQASVYFVQGVAAECGGVRGVCETRGSERA